MSHDNMHAWSTRLRCHVPEASVVAVLADRPGYLVMVDRYPDAQCVSQLDYAMRRMGATGWNWTTDGDQIKVRVYMSRRRPWVAMVALTVLLLVAYYDIHGITTAARKWLNK